LLPKHRSCCRTRRPLRPARTDRSYHTSHEWDTLHTLLLCTARQLVPCASGRTSASPRCTPEKNRRTRLFRACSLRRPQVLPCIRRRFGRRDPKRTGPGALVSVGTYSTHSSGQLRLPSQCRPGTHSWNSLTSRWHATPRGTTRFECRVANAERQLAAIGRECAQSQGSVEWAPRTRSFDSARRRASSPYCSTTAGASLIGTEILVVLDADSTEL
jgi:hypothetical protein